MFLTLHLISCTLKLMETIVLCADNEPATRCADCEHGYTDSQMDTISRMMSLNRPFACVKCGHVHHDVTEFKIWVRENSAKFLNLDTVRNSFWYHGTHARHWYESLIAGGDPFHHSYGIGEIMVHIGTQPAAEERIRHRQEFNAYRNPLGFEDWCVFTLRIKDNAPIHPVLQKDFDWFPETNNETLGDFDEFDWEPRGVTRYLNAFENPGSISLLANINALEVVEVNSLR